MIKYFFWILLGCFIGFNSLLTGKVRAENTSHNFSVLLAEYETSYAYKGEKVGRAQNIELASSKMNGFILNPNEVFSYNKLVGPRTEKAGFKKAKEILFGDLVEGIGGGVCQVAGTLHAAVQYAGLEIVESTQHTRYSTYIEPGLDSTVDWNIPRDLKFKNNYPFPVNIVFSIRKEKNKAYLKAQIFGEQKVLRVEIENKVFRKSKIKVKRVYKDDLPKNHRKLIEPGTSAMILTRVKSVYNIETNELLFQEELKLRYVASTRIIEIGAKQ